jgi:predicted ATPase/class 3 adenylate cyclase/DNA-binding CsgD family transcriptional regulator
MPRLSRLGSASVELPSGTLTFLISDIEQSTPAWEKHPDEMGEALEIHDAIFEGLVPKHDGKLVELGREGDSILCVFMRPSEALACALDVQQQLRSARWPLETTLRVRMALHTGEAEVRDGHYFGPALYRCARLLATAHGGQTILSGATHDLIVDSLPESVELLELGMHRLKDLSRPERIFQLVHPDLELEYPTLKSLDTQLTNLPIEMTSFLGREVELTKLKDLVGKNHLVTISGTGGLGKTRIALHLAAELIDTYPDGVWLVELAALSDPSLVAQAVATSVGVREVPGTLLLQTLTAHLQLRSCLIVLDNCEHLIAECALLCEHLLGKCPNLTILATSRERIGAPGERLWRMAPLGLPPAAATVPLHELMESEAVRLFVDRAWPNLVPSEVDEQRYATILQICRRLDGIPLAIELAAARAKVMTVHELLVRLHDRFRLLTGGRTSMERHQTLRATVDWSYELLEPNERKLYRRLSVFAGGFAMADVEAICSGDGVEPAEIVGLLERLVDKSLAIPVELGDRETPMRMLGTLQQYARERLVESGEAEAYLRRHADYFLERVRHANDLQNSGEHAGWLDRLERDHDNLRAALESSQADSAELNLSLASALVGLWDARGYLTEGRDWLMRALDAWPEETALRAEALGAVGWLEHRVGDFDRASGHFEDSIRIARATGQREVLARSLRNLALVRVLQGQSQPAVPLVAEAIAVGEALGDQQATAGALLVQALVAYFQGEFEPARRYAEASLAQHRELGDEKVAAFLLACLATLELDHGEEAIARSNLRESLEISRQLHEKVDVAFVLESCARLAVARSEPARALNLAGAAASVRASVGALAAPPWSAMVELTLRPARAALGQGVSEAAWKEGGGWTLDEAIDRALEWLETSQDGSPVMQGSGELARASDGARDARVDSAAAPAGLTKREREIAALVGRGLRNREIATRLYIALRTVDAHVEHIRNKLDFHSRAQIAAWAASQGLVEELGSAN